MTVVYVFEMFNLSRNEIVEDKWLGRAYQSAIKFDTIRAIFYTLRWKTLIYMCVEPIFREFIVASSFVCFQLRNRREISRSKINAAGSSDSSFKKTSLNEEGYRSPRNRTRLKN